MNGQGGGGSTKTLERGSAWRKWDLHVHSPLSALANRFPKLSDGSPDWDSYLRALEQLSDISVIGVTDYFMIEGYKKLREFQAGGRLKNISLLLPNIEFRLDTFVATSKGSKRLNFHVLFSDVIRPEDIENHFLQDLKFNSESEPGGKTQSWPLNRNNLEELGKKLKQDDPRFRGRSAFEVGCGNATVSLQTIQEVLDSKKRFFKGKYLLVLAEENTSLMRWGSQAHHTRQILLQGAHAIFSANPNTIRWAQGELDLSAVEFCKQFKSLKPCLHGSDAHCLEEIGSPQQDRFCWIKADTTFEGLKQTLHEPSERVIIDEAPPRLKNDYQVIDSIRIEGAKTWFDPVDVPINSELTAIIGGRGSGKSALAELLAFASGSRVFHNIDEEMFLYKASTRSETNPSPVTGAKIFVRWKDGRTEEAVVPDDLNQRAQEEKVKYLPQKFVERLCAPENTDQLREEIEKVVFQRISKTERRDASGFDELRNSLTRAINLRKDSLKREIRASTQTIAQLTARTSQRPAKEERLSQLKKELHELSKSPLEVPAENKEEIKQLQTLSEQKDKIEISIISYERQLSLLQELEAKFELFSLDIAQFNSEIGQLLDQVELQTEKEKFRVVMPSDVKGIVNSRKTFLSEQVTLLREGSRARPGLQSLRELEGKIDEINRKSQLTVTKRKEYKKYQQDRKKLEENISSLENEIEHIEKVLTQQCMEEIKNRLEKYVGYFALLKEEKVLLEKLYEPLQAALLSSDEMARKLAFTASITFDVNQHAARGLELLDRRTGNFRVDGVLEAALKKSFEECLGTAFDPQFTMARVCELEKMFEGEQFRKNWTQRDFDE